LPSVQGLAGARAARGHGRASLACSGRLAVVVTTRAISGTATTIMPFARTDRSSHHCRSGPAGLAAGNARKDVRDLTLPPPLHEK
jgi:hypothetical protein